MTETFLADFELDAVEEPSLVLDSSSARVAHSVGMYTRLSRSFVYYSDVGRYTMIRGKIVGRTNIHRYKPKPGETLNGKAACDGMIANTKTNTTKTYREKSTCLYGNDRRSGS